MPECALAGHRGAQLRADGDDKPVQDERAGRHSPGQGQLKLGARGHNQTLQLPRGTKTMTQPRHPTRHSQLPHNTPGAARYLRTQAKRSLEALYIRSLQCFYSATAHRQHVDYEIILFLYYSEIIAILTIIMVIHIHVYVTM